MANTIPGKSIKTPGKPPAQYGQSKSRPLLETKLIVLGQGSVGKTSLIHSLVNTSFNPSEIKTDGIQINRWQVDVPKSDAKIKVSIWDFGGQEIMHATHQFFLTKRGLYILVLDSRLTQEENRVEYWLKIIQAFGGESPVFIVGNKIDQHPLDIDRAGLQKKYPNIVGILETSAATGTGIDELKTAITDQVNNLPHVRDFFPETWFTVKTKLEEMGRESNFITHDTYIELFVQNKVSDETSQRTLIGFLHDLGVVLHFQDNPRLEALGILNPRWVTNGVYKILNFHAVFQNKGVLTFEMLDEALNLPEYPSGKRFFIIDMMKKFELCYDIEADKTFLIPDLLPKDQPDLKFNGVPAFEYIYPVLPSSIITRFIVRMNQKIDDGLVWRTGVLLKIGENKALVNADIEDRRITIAIDGLEHTRRDALSAIRYQLDDIHRSIQRLNPEKRVPIPGAINVEPLQYEYLLQLERDGVDTLPVRDGNRLVRVNVRELLNGIESEKSRRDQTPNVTSINFDGNVDGNVIIGDEKSSDDSFTTDLASIDSSTVDNDINTVAESINNVVEINRRTRIITDQPNGTDRLNYSRYAAAFADLITNPEMATPITIGIFGQWGSGKSFLMGKIKEAIQLPQQKRRWNDFRGAIQRFRAKKSEIDIHIIDFNAWVYSGSEHLWAGLVTHLYRDIEKHFGWKAHWMRLGKAIRKSLPKALGVFAFYGILGLGFSFLLSYNEIQESTNAVNLAVNALAASLLGGSALASLPALWAALREFFDSLFLSRANKLQTLAARPDFSSQIGVMADIKNEIKFIRELLKAGKNGKPTRLVLFIDDLDRCEHRKAVEVLQAIMLLLADEDGSPFVIFLGIDARVVVRAIEEHYGKVLVKAGINGYEYLDKIIQVPFVIPEAEPDDIENYVESLLWASDEEKENVTRKMTPQELLKESEKPGKEKTPIQQGPGSGPDLPTKAAMYDVQKEQPKPANTPAPEEIPVTFTQAEREALKACVSDLTGNPRKIKRIINIYRLARLILPAGIERAKAVRWILLTEQWPYHMAWIIEHIENDAQSGNKLGKKSLRDVRDVYQLARKDIHTEALETLLSIDADPGLFEQFIQKEPFFSVEEIKTLLPLTFNLNPAIRSEVCKHAIRLAEVRPQPKRKTVRAKPSNGAKESSAENLQALQPA